MPFINPYDRRPKSLRYAGRLASAVTLDTAAAGWKPTVDTFLDRITKASILEAVREAKGEKAAERIAHLKKAEMAKEAERLTARAEAAGIEAIPLSPRLGDFDEDLVAFGTDDLRPLLRAQLAPSDVARFLLATTTN